MRSWRDRRSRVDESLGRQLEQLRDGLQIPVRVVDMHVAEIRGQHGQERVDRQTGAIPVDERADRKAMTVMPMSA